MAHVGLQRHGGGDYKHLLGEEHYYDAQEHEIF